MKLLALVLLSTAVFAKHEVYYGWKSYFVGPTTQIQLNILSTLWDQYEVDVLMYPLLQREGVVLVKPESQAGFTKALDAVSINYRVHRDDIKKALDVDDANISKRTRETMLRTGGIGLPYDNYQDLDVIYDYLRNIANKYPETVTLVNAATTFEGRPLYYLRISTTNFEDESKPVIIIDGGIHAREWITPPVVTWAIHKLVEDVTEPDLLERFDWILMPVVNPDGYKHTFTDTRFWRKTRSTDQHGMSRLCPGVDGNRNYDFKWNTVGTSDNPCTDIFAGSKPFSEVETRAVRDILQKNLPRTALYLTMHSFGSMILYPWGHDGSLSPNALNLHTVGVAMAQAMDAKSLPNFPNYAVGNSALVLNYMAAGAAEDYAHSIGVPLAYTVELPGFGFGTSGFHLDPKYIVPVVEETWEGIVVGARRAGDLFRRN